MNSKKYIKMKKIFAMTVFTLFIFTQAAFSQVPGYWSFQYAMGFGSGDLAEYISQPSFRGGVIEYRKAIKDNVLVGVDFGWNVFYEKKDADTYTSGTEALSGVQYRTQNAIPILVSAEYFLSTQNALKPYVGLGIGTMYLARSTDMGQWRIKENPWSFAVKPELGFLYEMSFSTSFKLAAKYYNGFKTGQLENQGYFSISAGLAFHL
jgi:opacity protein-like surface antigen